VKNKKIFGLATALLLSMIVAGGLGAQDLKFDGYLNSGLGVVADDNKDNDPYMKAFGVDSESNGYRFRLNGAYTNEAKNAGARFRLQGQRRIDVSGYLAMPYAYGWVSFPNNNIFTLAGGIVMDSTWETADWWWNDDQGEGLGLLLKIAPVKGLDFGVGAYTISQQSGGNNNILSINNNSSLPNFGGAIIHPEDAKYTFYASYNMPDAFRLTGSFRTKNRAGWRDNPGSDYPYTGREESSQLFAEFRLLAVKGLSVVALGLFDTLDEFNDKGNITLSETFAFKANDDLNIGLNAVQFFYNAKQAGDKGTDPSLLFNFWGSYAIGKVVPRLDLVYFIGGRSKTVTGNSQWERRGFEATKGAKDADDDLSVFSARPSVKFNVDNRTFIELGDMINIDSGNYEGAYKDSGDDKKKSRLTNVFYIDLKFSF